MKIGNLTIENPLFLAPLAGVSCFPFRLLARRFGASMCYTEMISADALIRNSARTLAMIDFGPDEHPVGIQVCGSKPELMAKGVKKALAFKPDIIDINFGCPVPKVTKKNGGSALLKDPALAAEVIAAAIDSSNVPVTVKLRTGWTREQETFLEIAKNAAKLGIAAITLHARARSEDYSNKCEWEKIAALKREVNIPVIGNGDIGTPEDAKAMFDQTGCDGIMLGRAAMKNPHIFARIKRYLETGELIPELPAAARLELALEHARMMIERYDDKAGILKMRKHLSWYTRGLRESGDLRNNLRFVKSYNDISELFDNYLNSPAVGTDG